jgi:hypothetical protein
VETLGEKVHQGDDDALADREADLALHLLVAGSQTRLHH